MRRSTILAYHAIGSCPRDDDPNNLFVTEAAFADQMEYLARRAQVVTLAEIVDDPMRPGRVAITFDDGYVSVLTKAAPIMKRFGFPSTVFVPTRWIGERNTWDPPTKCDLSIMTTDQLVAAETAGIAVESHGHSHIDFGASDADSADADLARSIEILSEVTGRRPRFFAYPYGYESALARHVVAQAGFDAAFTIDSPHDGSLAFERVQVTPLDGPRTFSLKVSGRYMSVRHSRLVRAGYRVVRPVVRRVLGRGRS